MLHMNTNLLTTQRPRSFFRNAFLTPARFGIQLQVYVPVIVIISTNSLLLPFFWITAFKIKNGACTQHK